MQLYVSTNTLKPDKWNTLFYVLGQFGEKSPGLEIFPLCHETGYFEMLEDYDDILKEIPVTFHEPYYGAEHTAKKGSPVYEKTMDYCKKMFTYASRYDSNHVVYHLNNRPVKPGKREEMMKLALENLEEMSSLAKAYGQTLLVENTGVFVHENVLLNQQEFINFFSGSSLDCLLDIGHAHCNSWDLEKVICSLSGRIKSYHLHNNFQTGDDHNRLRRGNLDTGRFFELYNRYTPDASAVLEYRDVFIEDYDCLIEDIAYTYRKTAENRRMEIA